MEKSIYTYGKKWPWIFYLLPFILFSGGYLMYKIDHILLHSELEKRSILLQNESKVAATHLQKGIEKFSLIVFSIRSFISDNPEKNNAVDLQHFLNLQLRNQLSQDSLVVSYLDTNHIFQYSITQHSLTPNKLEGKSVKSFRSEDELNRLDDLMTKDNLILFPPFNLIEGWSGIPLNFRVIENGVVQGYIAPIMSLQSILDEVYQDARSNNFVYHFSTQGGLDFDRKVVYDSQKKYTTSEDVESFKKFNIPTEDFYYTSFTIHGSEFRVGAAYKYPFKRSFATLLALLGWLLIFALSLIGLVLFWRLQVKRQEQLELKNQELTNTMEGLEHFVRASSHDLKEPLRNRGSFSSLLDRRYRDQLDETAHQYLTYITSGVKSMNSLLDDLLVYANFINKPNLPKEDLNLNLLVTTVMEEQAASSNRQVSFTAVDLPHIYFNQEQASRLFDHLISNSIKHNNSKIPSISIGYQQKTDHHLVYIQDNGKTIEAAYSQKIFDVFQRLSRTQSGSGLGLAICKKIVEQAGGNIWHEAAMEGGNIFYFTLPYSSSDLES